MEQPWKKKYVCVARKIEWHAAQDRLAAETELPHCLFRINFRPAKPTLLKRRYKPFNAVITAGFDTCSGMTISRPRPSYRSLKFQLGEHNAFENVRRSRR